MVIGLYFCAFGRPEAPVTGTIQEMIVVKQPFAFSCIYCISLLCAASIPEPKKCIFAQPGTPYHNEDLCNMADLDETVFKSYYYSETAKCMAEILDHQNGTKIVSNPEFTITKDYEMPKTEAPDLSHKYYVKNVASFLGEEWVYGQNPRWRSPILRYFFAEHKIDGGLIRQSVWFLRPFLTATDFYGMNLNDALGEKMQDVIQYILKKLGEIVLFENIIIGSNMETKDKGLVLANYFAGLVEPGNEWLIPVYFSSAFGGHVILMSFVKTDPEHVDITVYNTGDGVNFHDTLQGHRHLRYNFSLKFSGLHVDHDLLNTTFFDIIIEFTTGGRKGEKYDAELFYNNVLGRFNKYRVPPSKDPRDYSLPQKAGNCYQKVVLAYKKAKLGYESFKKLESRMRTQLISKLFEQKFYMANWFQQEIVLRSLRSEARTWTRKFQAGKLAKDELGQKIEDIKEKISVVSSQELDRYTGCNIVSESALRKWLNPISSASKVTEQCSSETAVDGSILYNTHLRLNEPDSFIEGTKVMATFVSSRARKGSRYHGFAWMLKLPLPTVDGDDHYKQFTPEQFSILLDSLISLLKAIAKDSSRAVILISTAKCLALAWRSLISKGSPLASASLDLQALKQPCESEMIHFYTPEMLKEYTSIVDYLETSSLHQGGGKSVLFQGLSTPQSGPFNFMSESSVEYQFLNSLKLSNEEVKILSELEENPPSSAEYRIKSVLKGEKLRLAYLYMIKNDHVPGEFHLLRDLLSYVSDLSYSSKIGQIRFYMAHSADKVYFIFKSPNSRDSRVQYRDHNIGGSKFSSYSENDLVVKEKPLASPLKIDLVLLAKEPCRTKIFFAINCVSQYYADIFSQDLHFDRIRESFFQGSCLAEFLKSNPLEGPLALKKAFTSVSHKVHSTALISQTWKPYKNCKDLEALLYHWLDEVPPTSLKPQDCPSAFLKRPDDLLYIGKKPVYIQEILALRLKESYPQSFVTDLVQFETVRRLFEDAGMITEDLESSLSHEYPYLSAEIDGHTYIYDFWNDEFFSGKMVTKNISGKWVVENCEMSLQYLDSLAETGEFRFGKNRYGLMNKTICKIDKGVRYVVEKTDENFKPFSSFHLFKHQITDSETSCIVDFKLPMETNIAGKTFLTIQCSGTLRTTHNGQNWTYSIMNEKFPNALENFGENRSVLVWKNEFDENLYIFTDMFTDDLQSIIFKCSEGNCFYQGLQIVKDGDDIYKRYPQSVVFTDKDEHFFALLPMESRVNNTKRTPCIKFELMNGKIIAVKREKKIQLSLYFLCRGLYQQALDTLQSVVLVSKFSETELIYLNNIIYYNRDNYDSRPEQASVSYYALYMKFKLGNQELTENKKICLFEEFAFVKGKDAEIIDRYYTLIGRIPSSLLVTSPVLCSSHLTNSHRIGCQEEIHLVKAYFTDHPRLSQVHNKVGQISSPILKNKTLQMLTEFSPERIEFWRLIGSKDLEIVRDIQNYDSKLRIKKEHIISLLNSVLLSIEDSISGLTRSYIESLIMTAEIDSSCSHLYMIILAVLKNPQIASDLKSRLECYKEYAMIVKPELAQIFEHLGMGNSSFQNIVIDIPSQLSYFAEDSVPLIDLKSIRMQHDSTLSKMTMDLFDPVKEFFEIKSLKTESASSFSKLEKVLLHNSVISRPVTETSVTEEYNEMWNKLMNQSISLKGQNANNNVRDYLKELVAKFEKSATSTEADLLALANTASELHKEEFSGLLTSDLVKEIKFETLLRAYVTEDSALYYQLLKHVERRIIPKLHLLMNDCLSFVALHRRAERALKAFEQGAYSKLFEELQHDVFRLDIIPVALVMEYHLGYKIRPKNIKNIWTMTTRHGSEYINYVLQAIMGSGKTEVINPALAFLKADGEHISMSCPPSTHFETNSEKLVSYSKNIFGQQSYILNFNRDPNLTNHSALEKMHESLVDSIKEKKLVIVKFESLQSMVNQFISLLDQDESAVGKSRERQNELIMLGKNLELMKNKGSITYDEVDFTFKTNRMFNFPAGVSQDMDIDTVETIKMVLRQTVEVKDELFEYDIFPQSGHTQNISNKRYEVVKIMAKTFVSHLFDTESLPQPFSWIKSIRPDTEIFDKLVNFIVDEPLGLLTTLSSLNLDKKQIHYMILVQNLIQSIVPDNWATVCNLHYGFSNYANLKPSDSMYCGVAKPFRFSGEPNETSSWANKYETAVKTFQMYLENGISEQQYTHFINHLQRKALEEAIYYGRDLKETDVLARFISYKLTNEGEEIKLFHAKTEASDCLSQNTKDRVIKQLKGTTDMNLVELILDFVFEIAMKKEIFYSSQIVNNGQFMGTRVKVNQGFSGTAQRDYQFWGNAEFIPDTGASIAVQSIILGQSGLVYQIENETDAIFLASGDRSGDYGLSELIEKSRSIQWSSPDRKYCKGFNTKFTVFKTQEDSVLEEVDKGEKVRAMIDLGAYFRTMRNENVAKNLLEYSSDDIMAIVYYNQENRLSFFKKLASTVDDSTRYFIDGPHELHSENTEDILKEIGCSLGQIFIYYDQKHIIGSNFKMIEGAVAYVTVGPTTTRTDLEQAVMRMRGLLAMLQTLRFILTKDVGNAIKRKPKESGDGNEEVGLFGIIRHCIDNEAHIFKSPDITGKNNMQNIQLLYQKVKAQYMDVAYTYLTRLAAGREVERARVLFKDVRDWFIETTDEFEPIEESHYYETKQVLLGFSDRLFEHLNHLPDWKPVQQGLARAKEAAENAIKDFVQRDIVEPKTPSPVSRKNQSSTEVQNENQTQSQNQNQNQRDIEVSTSVSAACENNNLKLTCRTAVSAVLQMKNIIKENNFGFFDDNIKISPNFIKTESENGPFIKSPAYFARLDKCIVAITHMEMELISSQENRKENVFILVEDTVVKVNGDLDQIKLTENDLVNLLILKGDFGPLNRERYNNILDEWVDRRKYFGPELIPTIDSYDVKKTGLFKSSPLKKKLHDKLLSDTSISMTDYSQADLKHFKRNPLLGLEIIFRSNSPTFEEFKEHLGLRIVRNVFCNNDISSIHNLLDINPDFFMNIENLWEIAKGLNMLKFEELFDNQLYAGKVLDITVLDVLGLMYAAELESFMSSRKAVSKFMRFARDKRMITLTKMFYEFSYYSEEEFLPVLHELIKEFPNDFKKYPNTSELMSIFASRPCQSIMALHVLDFIGISHDDWVKIFRNHLEYPSEFMHIPLEALLRISNAKKLFHTDPSLLDEFVRILSEKQEPYAAELSKMCNYLLEQDSEFFEKFARKNNCGMSALVHAIKIGHVDEPRLYYSILNMKNLDEITEMAFDLIKNPQQMSDPDLFPLIPHCYKCDSLVLAFFNRYKFDIGLYLCDMTVDVYWMELSEFRKYADVLRSHPEYMQKLLNRLQGNHCEGIRESIVSILNEEGNVVEVKS